MRFIIFTTLLLLPISWLQAQDSKPVKAIIQQLLEHANEEQNIHQLYEDLEALHQNPINLNTATKADLLQLFFLDDRQITSILKYRQIHGFLLSVYELQAIPYLDELAISYLLPFIKVAPIDKKQKHYLSIKGYQRVATYLENAKGFDTDTAGISIYNGAPYQVLSKISANYGSKAEANMVYEKDRGEAFINPKTNQLEFISASLGLKDIGIIDQLIIGDYKLFLGQGLIASTDRFMGKSMPFDGVAQRYNTFVPYRSSGEANFMRGAAISTHWKNLQLHTFGSNRKKDATLDTDSNGEVIFNNFNASGLHRTTSEIENSHSIEEKLGGVKVVLENNLLNISIYSLHSYFNQKHISYDRPDSKHLFNGKTLHYNGLAWRASLSHISCFGEIAADTKYNYALITGTNLYPNDFTTCQILYRYYPYEFYSLYGSAFSEGKIRNEEGCFIKLITNPISKTTFTGYIDIFHFPGIRYGEVSPTKGKSFFFRTDYSLNNNTNVYIQLKYDTKETSISESAFNSRNEPWQKWQSYIQLASLICPQIKLKTKVGYVAYKLEKQSNGFLFLQDITWSFWKNRAKLNARYAVFETDDYNSRLYAYENDVLYYFAIPAYSGKGQRMYLNARFKVSKQLTIEAKYGRYNYWDRNIIGSGNDLISGSKKSDLKVQIRWRL